MEKRIGIVYIIRNICNGNMYVGSTVSFNRRKAAHLRQLKLGKHHSIFMQREYNKGGIMMFCVEYEGTDYLTVEQKYINSGNYVYNTAKDAIAPMLGRKHTDDTLKLLSKIRTGKKIKQPKWSNLRKLNASKKRKGMKHSKKTREKMSRTAKRINAHERMMGATKRQVFDSDGILFSSLTEAAIYHEISIQTVNDILKGRHYKTRKGISFEYF